MLILHNYDSYMMFNVFISVSAVKLYFVFMFLIHSSLAVTVIIKIILLLSIAELRN